MSMIEGDGDGDMCEDDEVKDGVVVGDRDKPLGVNEGWDMKLVSKSSNGHQSNAVSEAPEVIDCPNKDVVVSCLATAEVIAATHPKQVKIRRVILPKYIAYRLRYDDDTGSEGPRFDRERG